MSTQINYQGNMTDFKSLFYDYCKVREGYRNVPYKDVKGLDTVGIGHLIRTVEPFAITDGVALTDAQVEQLFDNDFDTLNVGPYTDEIANAGYSYNMMLAVGHFIWGHGAGQYSKSQLRSGLLDGSLTGDNIESYLTANWDIHSPSNQKVNTEDFTVGFDATPWTSPFGLRL